MDFVTVLTHENLKAIFDVLGFFILGGVLCVAARMVVWNATR